MLVVETIAKIRRLSLVQGKSIKAICRELKISRKVVRKVLRSGDTEFRYERKHQPYPRMGAWARRASLGVKVVVTDISREGAQRVVDEIVAAGGGAAPLVANSASPEDNKKAVDFAIKTYGKLNYAVNNAGVGGNAAPTGEVDIEDWNRVIDINLNGGFYGMRHQIPAMLKTGAGESAIVNMASIHGTVAALGSSAYTATKHGVVGLTKNAAAEYGPQGLRINCVGPAYIDTPLLADLPKEFHAELVTRHPLGRLGRAEEVAKVVRFLLSEDASFVTGGYYLVDGGYTSV